MAIMALTYAVTIYGFRISKDGRASQTTLYNEVVWTSRDPLVPSAGILKDCKALSALWFRRILRIKRWLHKNYRLFCCSISVM
jgi:hypothetical protein